MINKEDVKSFNRVIKSAKKAYSVFNKEARGSSYTYYSMRGLDEVKVLKNKIVYTIFEEDDTMYDVPGSSRIMSKVIVEVEV